MKKLPNEIIELNVKCFYLNTYLRKNDFMNVFGYFRSKLFVCDYQIEKSFKCI